MSGDSLRGLQDAQIIFEEFPKAHTMLFNICAMLNKPIKDYKVVYVPEVSY